MNILGYWMEEALDQGERARAEDEVPVGAVLLLPDGRFIKCHNQVRGQRDPLAHAELLCLRQGAALVGNERLGGVLFTTLEPCSMCTGALILARVEALVFAAADPKAGACGSRLDICHGQLNHRPAIVPGLGQERAAALLQDFFRSKRLVRSAARK
jgi:tRNA(adenine34) deaminase